MRIWTCSRNPRHACTSVPEQADTRPTPHNASQFSTSRWWVWQGFVGAAQRREDYIGGLEASRYQGVSTSRAAHEGVNLWIGRFAGACTRAVEDATCFGERAQMIDGQWRDRLHKVRAWAGHSVINPERTLQGARALVEAEVGYPIDVSCVR
jgi:hypothetical protein